jgi:hypothetical protein
MATGVQTAWDTTAANNATADANINWAESQAPSTVNNSSRAEMAAVKKWAKDLGGGLLTAGTSTAYTLTTNEVFGSLVNGQKVVCRMSATNGTAPTLNVDSLGAVAIQSVQGTAILAGALLSGGIYEFTYYSAAAAWVVNNFIQPPTLVGDSGSGGTAGIAPAPASGDAAAGKVLHANGTWAAPSTSVAADAVNATHLASAIPAFGYGFTANLRLSLSAAAGALTVAVKGIDGNDASASNPILFSFQSSTAGAPQVRELQAALSATAPSTSTFGVTSGTPVRMWLVIFDDGGTLRLGLIVCSTSALLRGLHEGEVISSTVLDTASDSAGVFYSGSAVTTKPYLIVGFAEWDSLTTAGTWVAPDRVKLFGAGCKLPGEVVQAAQASTSTATTGITSTTPQNTNLSQAFTPTSRQNRVRVTYQGTVASVNQIARVGLFRDASQIGPMQVFGFVSGTTYWGVVSASWLDSPNGVASVTYMPKIAANTGATCSFAEQTVASLATMLVEEIVG